MILEILRYPDPVLAKKAEPVAEMTAELKTLIADMAETMYEKEGVGLAAPQVGRSIRLITLDPTGPKERKGLIVILNPEIMSREGFVEDEERCLSVADGSCKIIRSDRITVRGQDQDLKTVEYECDGYLSRIFQHEIDHLEGVTIVEHMSRLKRTMYEKKIKKWQK